MTILYVFGSPEENGVFGEIVAQCDKKAAIDFARTAQDFSTRLFGSALYGPPDILLLGSAMEELNIDQLVYGIRQREGWQKVPIFIFLAGGNSAGWRTHGEDVYLCVMPRRPSQLKHYVRIMLSIRSSESEFSDRADATIDRR